MKFVLSLFAMLSVAVGQTVFLNLKLSDASSKITAANIQTLTFGLRGLINENVPQDLIAKYGPSVQAIELVQTLDAATKVLNIQAFVPLPSGTDSATLLAFLKKQYAENAEVKKILSVVLPTLCGSCKLAEITAEELSTDVTISPTPANTPKIPKGFDRHRVGLALKFSTYTPLTDAEITAKMASIPTLLNAAFSQAKDLSDDTKEIISKIVAKVKYLQPCKGTEAVATCTPVLLFPNVPSTYVELYSPVVKQYIVDNAAALTQASGVVPSVLGCGGCKLDSWSLFDEKVTASPTANPTASPIVSPTAAGGEGSPAATLFVGAASSVLVGVTTLALF